jgi:hypothetical protein
MHRVNLQNNRLKYFPILAFELFKVKEVFMFFLLINIRLKPAENKSYQKKKKKIYIYRGRKHAIFSYARQKDFLQSNKTGKNVVILHVCIHSSGVFDSACMYT